MPEWIVPTVVAMLAAMVGYIGRRVLAKLDHLETLVQTELRAMDVRIARIEEHLWPGGR